ncbi:hypothetical protein PDR5_15510 [Pseudomonas sp. DR 5-09]|nr:hypothetical protein PDR5_15510 [Pseudomonas sp. DR 5-09]
MSRLNVEIWVFGRRDRRRVANHTRMWPRAHQRLVDQAKVISFSADRWPRA